MTQRRTDNIERRPGVHSVLSPGVPELVGTDRIDPRPLCCGFEGSVDPDWSVRLAAAMGEHIPADAWLCRDDRLRLVT